MTSPMAMKALRIAAPYLSKFRGRVLVIKIGGEILENESAMQSVGEQLAMLWQVGIQVVIVHGGGNSVDQVCERIGLETKKVDGRRITSPEVLEVIEMTLAGTVQVKLLKSLQNHDLPTIGLTGVDSGLITAKKREPVVKDGVALDFGQVGDIVDVKPNVLTDLLDAGFLPVVAPLTADAEGNSYNTNADTVAAHLAKAMNAHKLLFIVGVPGVCRDINRPETLVPYATWDQVEKLISEGVISGGMLPKLASAKIALDGGVSAVHLVGGNVADSLLTELFTNEGSGTMIDLATS